MDKLQDHVWRMRYNDSMSEIDTSRKARIRMAELDQVLSQVATGFLRRDYARYMKQLDDVMVGLEDALIKRRELMEKAAMLIQMADSVLEASGAYDYEEERLAREEEVDA